MRFGIDYKPFEPTEENVKACFELVDRMDREDRGRLEVTETTVARPSRQRQEMKGVLAKQL